MYLLLQLADFKEIEATIAKECNGTPLSKTLKHIIENEDSKVCYNSPRRSSWFFSYVAVYFFQLGLLLSERLLNIPYELIPPLHDALFDEILRASNEEKSDKPAPARDE